MSNGKQIGGLVLLFIILVAGAVAWWLETRPVAWAPGPKEPTFCTMDAKLCPDGSAVGRVGPNCEFAACPGEY